METKNTIISPVNVEARKKLDLRAGDTIKVWQKIQEGGKTRLQSFEGLVLARKHGSEAGGSFTVRKVMDGVGVEKIFPLYSPNIDRIEVLRRSKVRRAKLYYVREKAAKEIRHNMRKLMHVKEAPEETAKTETPAETAKDADVKVEETKA